MASPHFVDDRADLVLIVRVLLPSTSFTLHPMSLSLYQLSLASANGANQRPTNTGAAIEYANCRRFDVMN